MILAITGSRADYEPMAKVIELLGCDHIQLPSGLYGHEDYLRKTVDFAAYDAVLLLGDRYEILVAATLTSLLCKPIIHLSGGDETLGAVDNGFRSALTKLAYYHFPICQLHADRIIQMGESPDRVFTIGCPAVDALADPVMSREEVEAELGIELKYPMALVLYHPETLGDDMKNMNAILALMRNYRTAVISGPNADIGGQGVREYLEAIACYKDSESFLGHTRLEYRPTYSRKLWLSLMHYADVLIGNSSGFVIEGLTAGKEVIMIGDRQKGRYQDALTMFEREQYPFGNPGTVSKAIADKILSLPMPMKPIKEWHDIQGADCRSRSIGDRQCFG